MTLQKRATIISSSVAATLAILKLIVGISSNSVAVLASAIDSLLDLAASLFNYFAVHNAEKPADEKFNYGRGKIEAIASSIEGSIISISGAFILYESISKIINNKGIEDIQSSLFVMIISFIVTALLVLYLDSVAKKTNNMVIKADSLHYKTDLYTNGSVLISLVIIYFTGLEIIDGILGAIIAVYIIYSAYGIIKDGILMLMDRALDENLVNEIKKIIESEEKITSYHYLKTRSSGKHNFVDVHLVFNKTISLLDAHNVSDNIEDKIKKLDENVDWIINIHLDPVDDSMHSK